MVDQITTPAEFLYESCTCTSGMRNGLRCADCGGRGILPKGTKPTGGTVAVETTETTVDDGIEDLSIKHLQSRAKDLGLSAGGSRAALVARIREALAAEAGEPVESAEAAEGGIESETPAE